MISLVCIVYICHVDSISKWFFMSGSQIRNWILGFEVSSNGIPSLVKVRGSRRSFFVSIRVLLIMGLIIGRPSYVGVHFHQGSGRVGRIV